MLLKNSENPLVGQNNKQRIIAANNKGRQISKWPRENSVNVTYAVLIKRGPHREQRKCSEIMPDIRQEAIGWTM